MNTERSKRVCELVIFGLPSPLFVIVFLLFSTLLAMCAVLSAQDKNKHNHLLIFKIMGTSATLHCNFQPHRAPNVTTVFKSYVHLMVLKVQLKGIKQTCHFLCCRCRRRCYNFPKSESNEIVFRWHRHWCYCCCLLLSLVTIFA